MAQTFWSDLWTLLNTDVQELGLISADTAITGIEGAQSLIALAGVLEKHRDQLHSLSSILEATQPLLTVLDSPMAEVVGATLPFGSIGLGILKACLNRMKTDPTLSQGTALVGQAAYLESLQDIVRSLPASDLRQQLEKIKLKALMKAQSETLKQMLQDAKPKQEMFTDSMAQETVTCFHRSVLARAYTRALLKEIPEQTDNTLAEELAERVARNTHRFIYSTLANVAETVKPLAELYRNKGEVIWRRDQSLQNYLQRIGQYPKEQVFGESFCFTDIYIPLQAIKLDQNGKYLRENGHINLETWAELTLKDPEKQDQVLFIQAEPGRGKSVFCRMFSDWVRKYLYPSWIPILIRLRDVSLQHQFTDTLRQAVNADFAIADDGWLTDPNTRFLFLLDGFDELLLSQREGPKVLSGFWTMWSDFRKTVL